MGEVLKCLSFPVNLQALADAEQHLTKTLGSQYFHSFGQGSFLQFLATNDSLQRILGGNIIGCTEEAFDSVNEKRKQVISCIHQLKIYSNEVRYPYSDVPLLFVLGSGTCIDEPVQSRFSWTAWLWCIREDDI